MNERTVKHLELIQAVITRLAQNSFAYKAWAVIIVTAIFALAAKQANPHYLLVALIPTLVFWGLDAYYLRQERLFRRLYDAVRKAQSTDSYDNPFSMDTSPYEGEAASWWGTCWSKTIGWLYLSMVLLILAVAGVTYLQR